MYGRGFDGEKIILSEPMQYTGKKDKRNVEIYGGDILKFLYLDENKKVMLASGIYLIEWSDEVCGFICERQEPYNYLLPGIGHECEIVGDIYNNPELMETGEEDFYNDFHKTGGGGERQ